jgi:hypothetical protein
MEYALIEVSPQQSSHSLSIGSRQEVCPDVFRPDGIGFLLLKVLALIIPGHGHRKGEADDEA